MSVVSLHFGAKIKIDKFSKITNWVTFEKQTESQ